MNPTTSSPSLTDTQIADLLARAQVALCSSSGSSTDYGARVVETVCVELERHFVPTSPEVHVLRRTKLAAAFQRGSGRPRSEFLYDGNVAEFGSVTPPVHKDALPIRFPRVPILHFECELSTNTAAACEDFGKLVCGSARYNLFIGPRSPRQRRYLDTFREIAPAIHGELYVAFFPRFSRRDELHDRSPLFRWERGTAQWTEIAVGSARDSCPP